MRWSWIEGFRWVQSGDGAHYRDTHSYDSRRYRDGGITAQFEFLRRSFGIGSGHWSSLEFRELGSFAALLYTYSEAASLGS